MPVAHHAASALEGGLERSQESKRVRLTVLLPQARAHDVRAESHGGVTTRQFAAIKNPHGGCQFWRLSFPSTQHLGASRQLVVAQAELQTGAGLVVQ